MHRMIHPVCQIALLEAAIRQNISKDRHPCKDRDEIRRGPLGNGTFWSRSAGPAPPADTSFVAEARVFERPTTILTYHISPVFCRGNLEAKVQKRYELR